RRETRDEDEILSRVDRGRARAEQLGRAVRDRDDTKRRDGVVQRHLQIRVALRVELDAPFPEQQAVELLAGTIALAPTAAAVRHGLAAIVTLADDLHLRRRG